MRSVTMQAITGLSNGVWNTKTVAVPTGTVSALIYCPNSNSGVRTVGSGYAQEDNTFSPFRMIQVVNFQVEFWSNLQYYVIAYSLRDTIAESTYPDITPVADTGWQTVDISAYVPVGTKVVEIHYNNPSGAHDVGARHPSVTTDLHLGVSPFVGTWEVLFCGVSNTRTIQLYKSHADYPLYKLMAYGSGFTANTAVLPQFTVNICKPGGWDTFGIPNDRVWAVSADLGQSEPTTLLIRSDDSLTTPTFNMLNITHMLVGAGTDGIARSRFATDCYLTPTMSPYIIGYWDTEVVNTDMLVRTHLTQPLDGKVTMGSPVLTFAHLGSPLDAKVLLR